MILKMEVVMDISKAKCPDCGQPMRISRTACPECGVQVEAEFEISALARLPLEDQVFVVAFLRHHGSIKKMEQLFGISYPTVKNRLNAIVRRLDESFAAPTPNALVLEALARGEITVDEALRRME
ncbi:MAG: DUF2089 family protein [Candidatus Eisenbacteria bacterium]|nr:DUF2089 family protein [Candidatus Eisenbacteria bacterium]